jgi:hypothetical protein
MSEQMTFQLFPAGVLYTAKEVAQKFGRTVGTVYRWRKRLGLNASGPSARTYFFTGEELQKLLLPRPAPAPAAPVEKAKGKRKRAKL